MNQKFKTLILWALPIILVIALSYQFLSSSTLIHLNRMEQRLLQETLQLQELVMEDS